MRFFTTTMLLAACIVYAIAKPIPFTDDEIQKRWSLGESEGTIHAADSYRDATPAWPVVRSDLEDGAFTYATDERTMEMRKLKHQKREDASPTLKAMMKAFVEAQYRKWGEKMHVARREVDEAPVLKPRRGVKHIFRA